MKTVFILGITSDIGRELGLRFMSDSWRVTGTCRPQADRHQLPADFQLFECDLGSAESIDRFIGEYQRENCQWDVFIVAAGTEEPIGSFWECEGDAWDKAIAINALAPLRVLRALWPYRNKTAQPAVAFFSGAGTNNAAPAYSAYSSSKIFLIKMCELLDAESLDTSFFILGPGIVRTKIHDQTLRAPAKSGPNYKKVVDFLGSEDPGTSHDDIYSCLRWCIGLPKEAIGGRNISIVYDPWRKGGEALSAALVAAPDLYKLRRFGNDFRIPEEEI